MSTTLLDSKKLDSLRLVGDPEADAVIRDIYPKGREAIASVNKLFGMIERNDDPIPSAMPESVRSFLDKGASIGRAEGGWDEARLLEGSRFFENYGLHIPLLLQVVTMPLLYGARKGVQVLSFTERLEKSAHRRSIDTGQLVFDTMPRGGLLAGGTGQRSAQKTRLVHAAVRYLIQRSGRWDEDEFGVPINQEDLLGTLGGFSVAIVDALRKCGASFTDEEADAFYYRWRAIGELVGIHPDIIAPDLESARSDFRLIQRRQNAPCPESQRLIDSWIVALGDMLPSKKLGAIVQPAIRFMIGPELSRILGLETDDTPAPGFAKFAAITHRIDRFVRRGSAVRTGINALASAMLRSLYVKNRGPNRHSIALPITLGLGVKNHRTSIPSSTSSGEKVRPNICPFARAMP